MQSNAHNPDSQVGYIGMSKNVGSHLSNVGGVSSRLLLL